MMIRFGICCWIPEVSQLPELKRCLDSVKDFDVIVVNGKWYDIEGDNPYSIPEARSLIEQYPNVTRIDYANHHEWESRNQYLKACEPDDVLIWLDTDEWVKVIGEFAPAGMDSFKVRGHDERCGGPVVLNRGFLIPLMTRHKDRHNEAWINHTKLMFEPIIEGMIIYHDKQYRSEKREKAMYTRNHLKPFR